MSRLYQFFMTLFPVALIVAAAGFAGALCANAFDPYRDQSVWDRCAEGGCPTETVWDERFAAIGVSALIAAFAFFVVAQFIATFWRED